MTNTGNAPAGNRVGATGNLRLMKAGRDFYPVPVLIPGAPLWAAAVEAYRCAA